MVAGIDVLRQLVPVPKGKTGVAALDGTVEVVPVVEDPQIDLRFAFDIETAGIPVGLQQAEEVKNAVKHADVFVGGNGDKRFTVHGDTPDQKAFPIKRFQSFFQLKRSNDRRSAGRSCYQQVAALKIACVWNGLSEQAFQPHLQLFPGNVEGGGFALYHPSPDGMLIGPAPFRIRDPLVAQPEPVAVFGF